MSCFQNVKAYVGYTQEGEWCVVMVSNDAIACECHSTQVGFSRRPPFSWGQWEEAWRQCEEKFLHDLDATVKWEKEITDVLLNKTSKIILGKIFSKNRPENII